MNNPNRLVTYTDMVLLGALFIFGPLLFEMIISIFHWEVNSNIIFFFIGLITFIYALFKIHKSNKE